MLIRLFSTISLLSDALGDRNLPSSRREPMSYYGRPCHGRPLLLTRRIENGSRHRLDLQPISQTCREQFLHPKERCGHQDKSKRFYGRARDL